MNYASISFWVTVVKDALTGLAAVAAVVLGILGLRTWERQLIGTAHHEVARRLLRATYRLREVIKRLRAPIVSELEMVSAIKAAGLDLNTTDRKRWEGLAYDARWSRVVDAWVEFDAEMLEAEAVLGSEVRKCEEPIVICMNRMQRSLQKWPFRDKLDAESAEKVNDVISDERDTSAFSAELKSAFEQIEAMIRPHLKPYNPKRKG